MNDLSGVTQNAFSQLSDSASAGAVKRAQGLHGESDHQKIERSSKEFESILLASWLQSAEKSFATVPGGDEDDENSDPGKQQYQGYAIQAVATTLTKAGGIGIAAMISKSLTKTAESGSSGEPDSNKKPDLGVGLPSVKEKI